MNAPKRPNRRTRIAKGRLAEMIEEATVDAHGESEQVTDWFTAIDENLAVPFETMVLGVPVTVERVDLDHDEQIVAVCRRGRSGSCLPFSICRCHRRRWTVQSGSMRTDYGVEKDDCHAKGV